MPPRKRSPVDGTGSVLLFVGHCFGSPIPCPINQAVTTRNGHSVKGEVAQYGLSAALPMDSICEGKEGTGVALALPNSG